MHSPAYRAFIKNNMFVLLGHVAIYGQGIILMPLIIKNVGATVYGGYLLLTTLLGFVYGISVLVVGYKRSRFLPSAQNIEEKRALFYPQFLCHLGIALVLSTVLILTYPALDRIFLKSNVVFAEWLILPYMLGYFLFSQSADYFRYSHKMGYFNFATITFPYLNILLIVLVRFLHRDLSVNILFISQIVTLFLISTILIFMVIKEIGWRVVLPKRQSVIEDIKLGFPLLLGFVVDTILSSSARYVIAALISVTAVGWFSPAYALGSLIIFLPKVSGVVLPPLISKAVDSGKESEAQIMLSYTLRGFLMIAIPYVAGCCVLGRPMLNLLANREVADNAYLVTPIIALATIFYGLNVILSNVFFVKMRTIVIFKANLCAALMNLALNCIFIFIFKNIVIAAIGSVVSYGVAFLYLKRSLPIGWYLGLNNGMIRKPVIASAVMSAVLVAVFSYYGDSGFKSLYIFGNLALGVTVYIVTLFVLRAFSGKEISFLRSMFLSRATSVS
ncbi:Uncharacterised protein [uncultured archaeon]|nr:Uncharacterised protein [uncultured archaeon]